MRSPAADSAIRAGIPPVWLATLTLPSGKVLRFSTQPLSVDTASSLLPGPLQYHPLLSGVRDYLEELDYFDLSGVGSLTQAGIEIAMQDSALALQSDWRHLTAASVELSQIWPGQCWEERLVLMPSGTVQGLQLGRAGQVTSLMLENTPPQTSALIGDDSRDLGVDFPHPTDTTPAACSSLEGRKYQYVFGKCESVPAYKVGNIGGFDSLVIAGHHFADTTTTVQTYQDGVAGAACTPINGTKNGKPYCYIQHATFVAASGAWTYSADGGGIARATDATRAAIGASDILRRLLSDSGLPVDWYRLEATLQELHGWRVGFYTDKQGDAVGLIRDRLQSWLPLVEVQSGTGLWYALATPWERRPVARLVLGQQLLGLVGRVSTSDLGKIRNSWALNYAPEESEGIFASALSVDQDTSAVAYLSRQLYGDRPDDSADCNITWDAATARRILTARAGRLALPRRRAVYLAAPDLYWLRAGDVVAVADPGLGSTDQIATVRAIQRSMTPLEITLDVIDRTAVFSR